MKDLEFINSAVVFWSLLLKEASIQEEKIFHNFFNHLSPILDQEKLLEIKLKNQLLFFNANNYYKILEDVVKEIGVTKAKDLLNQIIIDRDESEDCSLKVFEQQKDYINWPLSQANLVRLSICLEYYYLGDEGIDLALLVFDLNNRQIIKINHNPIKPDSFYSAFLREKKHYDFVLYEFIDGEKSFAELCELIGEKVSKSLLNLETTVSEYYCIIQKHKIRLQP